jgi:hypothetical protein
MEEKMNNEEVQEKLNEIITKLANGEITAKEAELMRMPLNRVMWEAIKELNEMKKSGEIKSIPYFESKK